MEGEENKKRNIMKTVKRWYENDKLKLIELYLLGYTFPEISVKMDRSRFAVESEMRLLRLQGRVGYRTSESEAAANGLADGIYLIKKTGKPVLFAPGCNKKDCVAVGIKLGSKSIAVALKDAADGKGIVLTDKKDKTKYDGYINNHTDAVADWNGKANTKHLEEIRLNEDIKLEAGQYIPAVGEMYLIYPHKKAINEALEAVGGEPIADEWYWTSTECSAVFAWGLTLYDGGMAYITKAANALHVRPVSAFICK